MYSLTPQHQVQMDYVSTVALYSEAGEAICRVYWQGGNFVEIRGQYAKMAWVGWMSYWRGTARNKPIEVKVPPKIMQKMKNNVI
jgi:hypothetical protein